MPTGILNVLNLLIVLFAIFFFVSTVASHLLEYIVGMLNSRGVQLRARLCVALGTVAAEEIYRSPVIKSLSNGGNDTSRGYPPSYIEPDLFVRVLSALFKDKATQVGSHPLLKQFETEAAGDQSVFEARVKEWYAAINDRQIGVYTRWSSFRLFLIGLALAVFMDIDVVSIGSTLWSDPALTRELADRIEESMPALEAAGNGTIDDAARQKVIDTLKDQLGAIKAAASGNAGADRSAFAWQVLPAELTSREWASKGLGWLLMAIATSLGAQFWFRLLNDTLKLRAAGPKPK